MAIMYVNYYYINYVMDVYNGVIIETFLFSFKISLANLGFILGVCLKLSDCLLACVSCTF